MNESETASAGGKNYADFSHDELIAEIKRLNKYKKYGLVWERKSEKVIDNFLHHYPYLDETIERRVKNSDSKKENIIIEGDNFDSLSILNYTHAGKVDVIYIDPPYNTGNKDFVYNDSYVDIEDSFRHSKWLSFMEPRLKLAKNLLADDGVIFISIDDIEYAALKMLCDDIFGENAFVANCIWQSKYTISNDKSNNMSIQTEYILCYAKSNASGVKFKSAPLREEYIKANYKNPDNDPNGDWMSVQMFKYKNPISYEVCSPTGKKWNLPWNFTPDSFRKLVDEGKVYWGNDGNSCPRKKIYLKDSQGTSNKNLFLGTDVGFIAGSSAEMKNIFNEANIFPYTKPSSLIKHIISLIKNPNAIVLDFFAGSGTTGQAVMELNAEDGSNRQFILCTNNGDKSDSSVKIAEDITYIRNKTVITGVRKDGSKYSEGLPENLRYYKVEYLDKAPTIDQNCERAAPYISGILQLKENNFNLVAEGEDYDIFFNGYNYLVLVLNTFSQEKAIDKLKEMNKNLLPAKVYTFSYSRDSLEEDYELNFDIEFHSMPVDYLRSHKKIEDEIMRSRQ